MQLTLPILLAASSIFSKIVLAAVVPESTGFKVVIHYVNAPDCMACSNSTSSLSSFVPFTTSSTTSSSTETTSTSTSTIISQVTVTYTSQASQSTTVLPTLAISSSVEAASTVTQDSSSVAAVAPSVISPVVSKIAQTTASAQTPSSTASSGQSLSSSKSGQATFYGGNVSGGMCSFSTYSLPAGLKGTALSSSNWDSAGLCGACLSVTGPAGNKITAMVVDQCPGCGDNHLDLFPDAFSALSNPNVGIIPVSWTVVPCPVSGPITLRNKEGTSAFWFSMQVLNSNTPVKSLEVSTDGGNTWSQTTRREYNFFENPSGFGAGAIDVKVTSVEGGVVEVKGVQVSSGSAVVGGSNF